MRTLRPILILSSLLILGCALPSSPGSGRADVDDSGIDTQDSGPIAWTWTPVLIDFDELGGEIDLSDHYAEVKFSTDDDSRLYAWDYASYSRSPPFTAYTANSPGGAGVKAELTFTFPEPVRNLEFYALGDQINGTYAWIEVFTEDGQTFAVDMVGDGSSGTAERMDLTQWEHVTKIVIRDMEDSYTVNLDDISFEVRGR